MITRPRLALGLVLALAGGLGGLWAAARWPREPLPPVTPAQAALARALASDVETLAVTIGERNAQRYDALRTAADWLARDLARDGYAVERQAYVNQGATLENIVATGPGSGEAIVVGAHYDTVLGSPGANDNGSGVAALRAIAHALAGKTFARQLRFVAFANEEYGFQTDGMGSRVYARRCRERHEPVVAMLSLETMGCYMHGPGSQQYPMPGLGWVYPDRGDFLAIVGNLSSFGLARDVAARFRAATPFPAQWTALPDSVPGVGWSDHWAFWGEGFEAVMITDTAPFRYPHYHTPADTPEKLDYASFARVVEALVPVVAGLAAK
ncbi:MAG: putative aminopeptidase [Cyanobacteria bacterium RYN_339]|nr:putative aminopeptidase [Cyanobacteria bacterium RYN_339]